MWEYLAAHPWWGLVYLLITCFTAIMATMGVGAAIGGRRKAALDEYMARRSKGDSDVVH